MLDCAENIQRFTAGMSLDTFLDDPKTTRAVAFELTTIGEAVRAVPSEIQDEYPEIPWGKMLGIRNVLVHEYFRVDEEILWHTVQEDIPVLIDQFKRILNG
jgi:uncharacterized protein with HEPN domain